MVTDEYDISTTFKEIFEGQKEGQAKRKCAGEATPVLDTLEQYIDQYLKSAGFDMTTNNEFYEWKKCIDNQNIKEDKGRKKGEITNSTSKGKDYRR